MNSDFLLPRSGSSSYGRRKLWKAAVIAAFKNLRDCHVEKELQWLRSLLEVPGCIPKTIRIGSSVSTFIPERSVSLRMASLGSSEFPVSRWIQPELDDLSSFRSVAVTKHIDQKQLAEERVYFSITVPYHNHSLKEVRTGNWRQELKHSQWGMLLIGFQPAFL